MELTNDQLKVRAKEMREFSNQLMNLYSGAEGLRDWTDDYKDKEVFNETRKHLHDLISKARNLAKKWERQADQLEMF